MSSVSLGNRVKLPVVLVKFHQRVLARFSYRVMEHRFHRLNGEIRKKALFLAQYRENKRCENGDKNGGKRRINGIFHRFPFRRIGV